MVTRDRIAGAVKKKEGGPHTLTQEDAMTCACDGQGQDNTDSTHLLNISPAKEGDTSSFILTHGFAIFIF